MATDPSTLSLSAIIEHMQDDLALVRKRLLQPGPLSPGIRVLAVQQVRLLRARLNTLHEVVCRSDADIKVLDDDLTAPIEHCALPSEQTANDFDSGTRRTSHARD